MWRIRTINWSLIIIQFILMSSRLFSQNTIAVIDFDSKDISASACISLSNIVRTEIMKTGYFTLVDRNNMTEILNEQSFQQTGLCTDIKCMVEIGKLLGVRKMVGGSIGQLGKKYIIDLKLIDVETGKLEKIVNESYIGVLENLDTPIIELTNKLFGDNYVESNKTLLYISSTPEGAKIYIDGVFRGNSPLKIEIQDIRKYKINAILSGFSMWEQIIVPELNKTSFIEPNLVKLDINTFQNKPRYSLETLKLIDKEKVKSNWGWAITVPSVALTGTVIFGFLVWDYEDNETAWFLCGIAPLATSIIGINKIVKANHKINELKNNDIQAQVGFNYNPKIKCYGITLTARF